MASILFYVISQVTNIPLQFIKNQFHFNFSGITDLGTSTSLPHPFVLYFALALGLRVSHFLQNIDNGEQSERATRSKGLRAQGKEQSCHGCRGCHGCHDLPG
jgi:hypothetical protein